MYNDGKGMHGAGRERWMRHLNEHLGPQFDSADFDVRFVRHLIGLLDEAGFSNIAFALLRSAAGAATGQSGREELDGLVDLGIQLMSREDRPFRLEGPAIAPHEE
jgi:hypothetical protein